MNPPPVSDDTCQYLVPGAVNRGMIALLLALCLFSVNAAACERPTGEMVEQPAVALAAASPGAVTGLAIAGADVQANNVQTNNATQSRQPDVAFEPTPFRATYQANYRGLPIRAKGVRELVREPDGSYRLLTKASAVFISVSEETRFRFQNGEIKPVSYLYQRKGLGRKRTVSQHFDAQNARMTHDNGATSPLPEGAYDKLLYQLQMKHDLSMAARQAAPWPEMNYTVMDGAQPRNYRFKVIGTEHIETPIGRLETVKTTRIRENSDRETTFWLSPAHDFLLVQLRQIEPDGSGFELYLKDLEH